MIRRCVRQVSWPAAVCRSVNNSYSPPIFTEEHILHTALISSQGTNYKSPYQSGSYNLIRSLHLHSYNIITDTTRNIYVGLY